MIDPSASNHWDTLSAIAWPLFSFFIALIYRSNLSNFIETIRIKLHQAREIKFRGIELKGPNIEYDFKMHGNSFASMNASKENKKERDSIYNETLFFMLAHRIKPSTKPGQECDISVFLVKTAGSRKNALNFGDIRKVDYYFGRSFGGSDYGKIFSISNPEGGFAITISATGPTLCIAKIHFRIDNKSSITYRFLDFEMRGAYAD